MVEKFERIYHAHAGAVMSFATSLVGRRDIAEDVTSETFLALLRNLDAIDESQLPGWLLTVARNRARDFWRRAALEQRYAATLTEDPIVAPGPDGLLDCPGLKPVHRLCLILRYVEGLTRAEMAKATGLSETQVKGHLQYALELLRKAEKESQTR
jgi:RNA polymerase sigma-70 factor (ECF subfamily)